jgi:hypothetical protein
MENEKYAFLLRMSMEKGTKGDWAKQQLAMMKPQSTIGSYDPHDFVSDEDILNRNNPEVIKRLQGTYWFDLSIEEQDRRFAETKAYYEKHEKEVADKNRLLGSGVGNQTIANILEGGSSILTHAIDTASFGMAGTITDWIVGPKPKGYVDPMDDPYGKKAGQFAGQLISIGLPFKYLKAVKTPGALGKFTPTLLKSMVSGAISGTVGEAFDAFNDYRDDGNQSLGERIGAVGVNTIIAGAGDVAIRAGSKVLASTMRFVSGKLSKIKVPNFEEIKKNVLENIGESKAARETSNYGEYLKKEKELLKEIEKKRVLEGTVENKLPNRTIDSLYEKTQNVRDDINREIEKIRNSDEYKNLSKTQRDKLDRKLRKLSSGNVAVADVSIPGFKKEFQAHSQIHSSDSVGSNVGDFSSSKVDKSLETYIDDEFPRFNDTEAKILEDIASQIKDLNVKGRIDLFTELDACQSCSNLIMEFRRKFPNIELNVYSENMK